jgi:hypothetical protein
LKTIVPIYVVYDDDDEGGLFYDALSYNCGFIYRIRDMLLIS